MTDNSLDPGPAARTMDAHGQDATLSMWSANLIGIAVFAATAGITVPIFLALWGTPALTHGAYRFVRLHELLPLFACLIVVHELLHAAGFLWIAQTPRSAIRFGVQWKTLTPYAHCSIAVPVHAYRGAVALPGLLLGVVPCIIALTFGSGWLLIWGALMMTAAGGDVAILWAIRAVKRSALVLDHPTRAGCLVLPPPADDISNPSTFRTAE